MIKNIQELDRYCSNNKNVNINKIKKFIKKRKSLKIKYIQNNRYLMIYSDTRSILPILIKKELIQND